MKRVFEFIQIMVCMCLAMVTIIVWRNNPAILNHAGNTLPAMLGQCLHSIMLLGLISLVMLIGKFFLSDKPLLLNNLSAKAAKLWLVLVGAGITCTFLSIFRGYFTVSDFYESIFPVLFNEVPILSGIIFGLLIAGVNVYKDSSKHTLALLLLLIPLFLQFIFGKNMFYLDNEDNPIIFMIIFLIGGIPSHSTKKHNFYRFLILIVCNLFLAFLMPYISSMNYSNLSRASRFSTISNPLLVLSAYYIVQLIPIYQNKLSRYVIRTSLLGLIVINISSFSHVLDRIVIDLTGHSTAKLIVFAAILSAAILAIGFLLVLLFDDHLRTSKLFQLVDLYFINLKKWDSFVPWILTKKKEFKIFIKEHVKTITMIVFSYILSALSMLLMNVSWNNPTLNVNIIMMTIFKRQPLVIMNAIFIFSLMMFTWAILRRYYVALIISILVISVWIVASRLKILARNEPIMPSELKMISVWGSLISMANVAVLVTAVIVVLLAVCLIFYLESHNKRTSLSVTATIVSIILLPSLLVSSLYWNHEGNPINVVVRGIGDESDFFNQMYGAQSNGPIVQFLNNIDVEVMSMPKGYSKASMYHIRDKYQKEAAEINFARANTLNKQNIIFNLSESFADPRRVPGVSLADDPIKNIGELKRNSTSGLMISSGYGGGTANMEYMTLTGFTLSLFSPTLTTPYTQLVGTLKHNPSIIGSFKITNAIHPYLGTFYSRNVVYQKFGVDKFYYLGSRYKIKYQYKIGKNPYLSDQTAYDNTLDQLRKGKSGQFIQLTTMQNHLPYDHNYYKNHNEFGIHAKNGTDTNSLADYTCGIHYTDKAVKQFIEEVDKLNKPITIVFYGDHLPGNIYGNLLEKDGLVLHETDYFIYSNKYAREHGAVQKMLTNTSYVDPNDFIAMVAEQTNSKVNWYQAMLTDVYHKLPAFAVNTGQHTKVPGNSGRTQFINNEGKFANPKKWTKQQKQLWHDYKLVQYDVTAGKQYLVRDGQLK